MENFSGLTPEEKARLLELEKSVALDKAKPVIKKDFLILIVLENILLLTVLLELEKHLLHSTMR